MSTRPDNIGQAVETTIADLPDRTRTQLRRLQVGDRLPPVVIRRHQRLTAEHTDAYLPLRAFGHCCLIAARAPAAPCADLPVTTVLVRAGAAPRLLEQMTEAPSETAAAELITGALDRYRAGPGLCLARLWDDLTGLTADKSPRGAQGRTMADRVRRRWHIGIAAEQAQHD